LIPNNDDAACATCGHACWLHDDGKDACVECSLSEVAAPCLKFVLQEAA
jgi:hypothetical protein